MYSENYQLPQYNDDEPRACIVTIVNINGRLLPYLVTHLDHLEESARITQAEDLLNTSDKIDSHKILTGDMNCHPGDPPIVVLEQTFTDTFNLVGNASDHIDYIFVSNDFNGVVNHSAFIINPLTQIASDHKPVIAEIVLQP